MFSVGFDKKIRCHWKSKSKITAEFEKKSPKSLLIRTGPGTGATNRTESGFEEYTK
jgi:hypothetical protein